MSPIAIAPMLDWTDQHFRYFIRKISKHTQLYTEMIVADAIIHGDLQKILEYHPEEQPLVIQLGGSDPKKLSLAAQKCQDYGYSAINLNVGCPSSRVKSGNFGACLMANPTLISDCIKSMQDVVDIPITIKHRIGLNYEDNYDKLAEFVNIIAKSGCTDFIIHARNAILNGLSPKQNREIPPLKYEYVYKIKQEFKHLNIMINGGIKIITDIQTHLQHVDGVMIGREAYYNPYLLHNFDNLFFKTNYPIKSRKQIALSMVNYMQKSQEKNLRLHQITRHMLGLYHGCINARKWRQILTTHIIKSNNLDDYTKLINEMPE